MNWREEYISRKGSIGVDWMRGSEDDACVQGLAILQDQRHGGDGWAVGHMGDSKVCLWALNTDDNDRACAKMFRTDIDMKHGKDRPPPQSRKPTSYETTERISIDSFHKRGYFVSENTHTLSIVDLNTMQTLRTLRSPSPILTLSQETNHHTPVTISTTSGLQICDIRSAPILRSTLTLPTPLSKAQSVLHPPSLDPHSIYAAGRFPAILHYDRRNPDIPIHTIYHGETISSLAAVPHAPHEIRHDSVHQGVGSYTLVAAGGYKGRGSLGIYSQIPLSPSSTPQKEDNRHRIRQFTSHNRTSASAGKILDVTTHGTRIVYADTLGHINFVERDVMRKIRKLDLNNLVHSERQNGTASNSNALFAQKLLPTSSKSNAPILFWTGEKVGRIRFGKRQEDIDSESGAEGVAEEESEETKREREYDEAMRAGLEESAREMWWMRRFGMGIGVA